MAHRIVARPARGLALERLQAFLPRAGHAYAARRNHDLGPDNREDVSQLSPYLRHRIVTEPEVLSEVLAQWSLPEAGKFVQEVVWRTYWKGWLEMRPGVWTQYKTGRAAALDRLAVEDGVRRDWRAACNGETGIDAFDHWAGELAATGYLHNHARMWVASIWIFTLRLPWELGADWFLRHLLDGDPASNTLGWRWVAGLQTRGKTYLATRENIERYTDGRFSPRGLATSAQALDGPPPPAPRPLPEARLPDEWDRSRRTVWLLNEDDLSPDFALQGARDLVVMPVDATIDRSSLLVAPAVQAFAAGAMDDCLTRHTKAFGSRIACGPDMGAAAEAIAASGAEQVVGAYTPVGPAGDRVKALVAALAPCGIPLIKVRREWDSTAWPHAPHGFFRFRERIPEMLSTL